MTDLVLLKTTHKALLSKFLADFHAVGEADIPGYFGRADADIDVLVREFDDQHRGVGLAPGIVPSTTAFLMEEGRFVGVVNLRHDLNDTLRRMGGHVGYSVAPSFRGRGYATRLLANALDRLTTLGVTRALLTCDPRNVGSVRVIEKNGGVLHDVRYVQSIRREVARYWIDVDGVVTP